MDMLYHLSKAGIQVYLATHNYFVIKQLGILARKHQESVSFCSLAKSDEGVECSLSDLREGMPPNAIVDASVELFERDVRLDMEL
jgi:hypothetical protein